jgi:hypothetical protein
MGAFGSRLGTSAAGGLGIITSLIICPLNHIIVRILLGLGLGLGGRCFAMLKIVLNCAS